MIANLIQMAIGAIMLGVMLAFLAASILQIIGDNVGFLRRSETRVIRNARKQRKKFMARQIEKILREDCEYYVFDRNTYEFRPMWCVGREKEGEE